jgi:hypothetical protein
MANLPGGELLRTGGECRVWCGDGAPIRASARILH